VKAYGIDQMYLRSLDIIQNYKISDLFFCFIPDDINRCNYSTFHKIQKPYFIIEGDSIKLIQIDPKEFSDNLNFNYSLFRLDFENFPFEFLFYLEFLLVFVG